MNPKVSVVIPVYNVEKFLKHCMESVMDQKQKNAEIILVDDGSTDNSGVLCDQYAQQYDHVKVIHQKNAGLSAARNTGIEAAKGEFITFVDSDDMLASGFLEKAMQLAELHHADFIAFSHIRCDADAKWSENAGQPAELESKVNIYGDRSQKMQKFLIGSEIGTTAWAKVYRKKLFDAVRYPVGKYHEDVFTTYKLVDKASKIVTTPQIGYLYRKSPNSITSSVFSPKRLDSIEGKLEQLEFIQKEYPNLKREAATGVIYACNQCLMLMAKAGYKDANVFSTIQKLYRNFGKYYLSEPVSIKGKVVTFIAVLSVGAAYTICKMIPEN